MRMTMYVMVQLGLRYSSEQPETRFHQIAASAVEMAW